MGKHIPSSQQPLKAPPHTGSSPVSQSQAPARRPANAPKAPDRSSGPRPTQEQIAVRAYEIWLRNGCHHGNDLQNWLDAEDQLHRQSSDPQNATIPINSAR